MRFTFQLFLTANGIPVGKECLKAYGVVMYYHLRRMALTGAGRLTF